MIISREISIGVLLCEVGVLLLLLAELLQCDALDCALVLLVSLLGDLVQQCKDGGGEHGPQ